MNFVTKYFEALQTFFVCLLGLFITISLSYSRNCQIIVTTFVTLAVTPLGPDFQKFQPVFTMILSIFLILHFGSRG